MKNINYNELKVHKLSTLEMSKTDGGVVLMALIVHHAVGTAGKVAGEVLKGAYERGYDNAQDQCECQ